MSNDRVFKTLSPTEMKKKKKKDIVVHFVTL